MKYYVLLERKERGCPVGSMQGIIYDEFVEDVEALEYWVKPWYNQFDDREIIFPGEMFLISRDKLILYDVRSGGAGSKFNLVSLEFLRVLVDFDVHLREMQPLHVVDRHGVCISKREYRIISFARDVYESAEGVVKESSILMPDEFGGQFSIESISIKAGVNRDLFKIKNIYSGQDPIFCSERFVDEVKVRQVDAGIEFRRIEEIDWASTTLSNSMDFLKNDSEPLLFIH
ncbi:MULTISPECIES: Imm43 family immunity protein [Burkholderia]|uniref:Immunity protein 43 domain-containing protein n=1 Tax=Burkholderia paludis TaxID=1506587 RepID=A0A6P2SJZ6_9BURK|nr:MULTISPECIES: hypothetical protein [Burkholderia]CAB3774220.1 hypothetical protein LMG30113_07519 [Burkholderia paludis]VWC48358.1 hypothetical protein BPA30113_07513 [Burkholderia paludis]